VNRSDIEDFFERLDRSYFIDNESVKRHAHVDTALPIGYEQTISQPSLVLEMTCLLAPQKEHKILEVGTGSGYQTALLAEFAGEVFTIERIPELAESAKRKLHELGYRNIHFKLGDGSDGWPEHAPYDRIMVTAAAAKMPEELVKQLKAGGKMVIPLGAKGWQELCVISKNESGEVRSESVGEVTFVEMKGKYGWT